MREILQQLTIKFQGRFLYINFHLQTISYAGVSGRIVDEDISMGIPAWKS